MRRRAWSEPFRQSGDTAVPIAASQPWFPHYILFSACRTSCGPAVYLSQPFPEIGSTAPQRVRPKSDCLLRAAYDIDRCSTIMAYVIAEPCIGTKDTACVDACPVDCIHPKKDEPAYETEELLYIDPVECIDCGACVPVCPVSAIFALDDLPEKWSEFTARNAAYYNR
jgi:ferredoxin